MSFACVFMVLLGSTVVVAFVLQPLHEESDGSVTSTGFHQRCHRESLESVKRTLLKALNLQREPHVPLGLLDNINEQWKLSFSTLSNQAHVSEEAHLVSVSEGGNSNGLKCCSMTSEVFMKELGWNNWVIYPLSVTITYCKLCSGEGNTLQCPQIHPHNGQVPCCHRTSQKTVPFVYMNEYGSVFISSLQLTHGCGCGTNNEQQPVNK